MSPETQHHAAFWLLGLINSMPFVIMMAGAKDIDSGGVGVVYLCQILPGLLVQATGPYWFHLVSYRTRLYLSALCMTLSFVSVVWGYQTSLALQLFGVVLSGFQSALGESSLLAYASLFDVRLCLSYWSSGSGCAGVMGYVWFAGLTALFDVQIALLLALVFPVLFVIIFETMFSAKSVESLPLIHDAPTDVLCLRDGLQLTLTLWPYMLPLAAVYAAQYAAQTGPWSAIGFPLESAVARVAFYRDAGTAWGFGVFVGRSTGALHQIHRLGLMLMSVSQLGLLVFFWLVAAYQVLYSMWLLLPCFLMGCLGGAVYAHAFTLLAEEVAPVHREFALAAASVAMSIGQIAADIVGLSMQGCLYSMHRLPGATFHMAC
ncbi:Aste57867_19462 [Aphanomyces stellatus]|uniref:Aste57867_19462 protein n=1 Tax=Aphanomyces stellatus TaxID=120398 RepID=A0A485LEA5_9STRA|nr:hypothetical protein As57867_019398 [Aphanomyces stellatus]VFT96174.1 Aste57867_19462 [Aphanomyces stellatus]